jgi:hypothetical protein
VALVDVLVPGLVGISSTVKVELSVVKELSCLSYILFVVVSLLLCLSITLSLVLSQGQTIGNVRVGSQLSNRKLFVGMVYDSQTHAYCFAKGCDVKSSCTHLLLITCTVIVNIRVRSEKVHSENGAEERLLLFLLSSELGVCTSSGGGRSKSRCRCNASSGEGNGVLHLDRIICGIMVVGLDGRLRL